MPTTFRIIIHEVSYRRLDVEAQDADEARDIAQDADADEFTDIDGGTWEIETVHILQNEDA